MSEHVQLKIETKEASGKEVAKALRNSGRIPCVIYGGDEKESISASLDAKEFKTHYFADKLAARIVDLELDGKKIQTLSRAIQVDPVSGDPIHADFQRLKKGATVRIDVHVRVLNQEKCVGIKAGGVLNLVKHNIELTCPPSKMFDHIDVDIKDKAIGTSVHIEDITLPEGVTPVEHGNFAILSITGRGATASEEEKTEEETETTEE